jgi:hypothetical protein
MQEANHPGHAFGLFNPSRQEEDRGKETSGSSPAVTGRKDSSLTIAPAASGAARTVASWLIKTPPTTFCGEAT